MRKILHTACLLLLAAVAPAQAALSRSPVLPQTTPQANQCSLLEADFIAARADMARSIRPPAMAPLVLATRSPFELLYVIGYNAEQDAPSLPLSIPASPFMPVLVFQSYLRTLGVGAVESLHTPQMLTLLARDLALGCHGAKINLFATGK